MRLTRRTWLLGMAASSAYSGVKRSGTVAFHYEAIFSESALRWYTRFDNLVTGAVLSADQTRALRLGGGNLIAYEWSSGFYAGEPANHLPWQQKAMANSKRWLLSEEAVGGGAAAAPKKAYWYDFGNPELRSALAAWLAGLLDTSGYDGLFFDTVGSEQLPAPMLAAFNRRWPKLDYDRCQGEFFAELRRLTAGRKIIFLNQGYRHAAEMLPYADMDLTESYFTALQGTRTLFRPWHDPRAPWESIRTPIQQLIVPAANAFPNVRFVHVNYAAGDPAVVQRAARYSWAIARLWDHNAYLIAPGSDAKEQDDIYFMAPGSPRSNLREDGSLLWREYERGIVAVNLGEGAATLPGLGRRVPPGPDGFFFPG